jgi:glutaredoxin
MLTLYVKTGCAYCAMVIHKLDELGLDFEEKNVADPGISEELIGRGGKRQMPYLVDSDAGVEMYESEDICDHLEQRYGAKA